MLEELGAAIAVGPEVFGVSHRYPEQDVELHFSDAALTEPRPLLSQEMKWSGARGLEVAGLPARRRGLITLLLTSA